MKESASSTRPFESPVLGQLKSRKSPCSLCDPLNHCCLGSSRLTRGKPEVHQPERLTDTLVSEFFSDVLQLHQISFMALFCLSGQLSGYLAVFFNVCAINKYLHFNLSYVNDMKVVPKVNNVKFKLNYAVYYSFFGQI